MQEVPEKSKESPGAPWQFVGLLPLFDPPRHDSAETIRKALNLGVNVKMITGNFFSLSLSMYVCAHANLLSLIVLMAFVLLS
jgi:hypothetical protein